jgi:hypothetical protein
MLELCEGKMTKAVVPSHEFSLIVGSGEVDVLSFFRWRCRIEGERPTSNGFRGGPIIGRSW